MRKQIIFAAIMFIVCCCNNKVETEIISIPNSSEYAQSVEYLTFNSEESLYHAINHPSEEYHTKAGSNGDIKNLFTAVGECDVANDPILSYEMSRYGDEEMTEDRLLYDVLHYDEMVPNEDFARLINVRGEFRVEETMYKISPRGTYYYPVSLREYFVEHYPEFEMTDGVLVKDKTYQMAPSVYRFDTFSEYDEEESELNTKACPIPGFGNYPCTTFTGTANNVLNNQLHCMSLSSERRLKTRVYNNDYVVYQERGAYVKVQKKASIGWKDIEATELSLGWNNIIMTKEYSMGINKPVQGSSPVWLGVISESFNGQDINIGEISGYSIPSSDFGVIVNGGGDVLFGKILYDTGIFITNCDAVRLYGFDKVQWIILPRYITRANVEKIKVPFTNYVLGPSYKFAAGQFFFVGKDGSLVGAIRAGTNFN